MIFRGHFDQTLDAKNRLNVPAKLRPAFSDGLVLMKSHDAPCITIFTPEGFQSFSDKFLPRLNPMSSEYQKLTRYLAGSSFDADLDSGGRVTLNANLLAHAGVEKDVVLIGAHDRLELWARGRWTDEEADLPAEAAQIAQGLDHPS
ncbi:MAG TPA: division/cell wall cluster transcriptional repressor MraZ [Thermoleophilaceae bacterium]|nr:division/cell wall cluster transcriptional repressor MraZ [Thermoleophilaceae bacterium]